MPLLRIITLTISLVAAIIFIALMDRVLPPAAASVLLDNTRASWPFTVQNGLWIAFYSFLVVRALALAAQWHSVIRKAEPEPPRVSYGALPVNVDIGPL